MRSKSRQNNEGVALLVSMIFLIMIGMLSVLVTTRVMDNARHVDKYVDFQNTFEGMEAGFAEAVVEIKIGGTEDGIVGISPSYVWSNGFPSWTDPAVAPVQLTSRPEIQYFAYTLDWGTDGIDNNGDGFVDLNDELNGYFSTYGFARAVRGGTAMASRVGERVVQRINVNIWANAIFAGDGQSGNLINGNVAVHGSVHLLGKNVGAGGIAIEALDMSGTSLIHNNYDGLSNDLLNRIPPLPTTLFNGEVVETLYANLRVKNGLIGLSGNSEIGSPDVSGNLTKELMDGIYVNDGWTGTNLDANGDPTNVFSENGWDEEYDLGDVVGMPTYDNDNGTNHLDYYLQTSSDAGSGLHYVYQGDLVVKPGAGNFYWDATTNTKVVNQPLGANGMPTKAALDDDHFYVWFDDASDTMVINGRIPVNGDIGLVAGTGASNKLINYEGKGTFLAYDPDSSDDGDVQISASLKTTNFPNTNLLGVHAQDDLSIGTDAQMEMMGAFYAQDRVIMDKQTVIVGTVVGSRYDMGTNVPEIYQIPQLPGAWEDDMRMIGAGEIIVIKPLSWRELAIL